ncbi:anti-sigma factor [uncultured Brevundimonas sp.]|uniref:anti-sigma factor family protein n=1 Tax=uncultured Brevundimonas sp. TaxID=213418 RepID=UPI0030EC9F03|tara:strand:+ start:2354 stop:3127 length:774 start_codon:yes stop_codon:yes gene_type:complete
MTSCSDRIALLNALIDGELDAVNSVEIEGHLETCEGCRKEVEQLQAIRETLADLGLRSPAPQGLRDRIKLVLDDEEQPHRHRRLALVRHPWRIAIGSVAAIAAAMTVIVTLPSFTTVGLQDQLVASHVRSLLAAHLIDVTASDRHVVKPWFNGRVDIAPAVVDLADLGFPLIGGRLDYVKGRVVPVLVYRDRLHTINVFVRPAGPGSALHGLTARRDGYSLVRWSRDGLEYWAVSDIDPRELDRFSRAFEAALSAPT